MLSKRRIINVVMHPSGLPNQLHTCKRLQKAALIFTLHHVSPISKKNQKSFQSSVQFSPKLEHLWGHQLQRVRRSVKVDHVELHRWVGLACLRAQHSSPEFRRKGKCAECPINCFQYIIYCDKKKKKNLLSLPRMRNHFLRGIITHGNLIINITRSVFLFLVT